MSWYPLHQRTWSSADGAFCYADGSIWRFRQYTSTVPVNPTQKLAVSRWYYWTNDLITTEDDFAQTTQNFNATGGERGGTFTSVADVVINATAGNNIEAYSYNNKFYLVRDGNILIYDPFDHSVIQVNGPSNAGITWTKSALAGWRIIFLSKFDNNTPLINNSTARIWAFNLQTNSWESRTYPGQASGLPQDIVTGFTEKFFIASPVNDQVHAFNIETMNYEGGVPTTARASGLASNQNGEVFVWSRNDDPSQIYQINQTLLTSSPFVVGKSSPQTVIDDERGNLWTFGGNPIARISKGTKRQIFQPRPSESVQAGIRMNGPTFLTTEKIIVTPAFTIEVWNGTGFTQRTIQPYVVGRASTSIIVAFKSTALGRVNNYNVNGTAMITTGRNNYRGEL